MFFDKPKQEYKQNKPPFRSTKAAFWKNETAFVECPNAVLVACKIRLIQILLTYHKGVDMCVGIALLCPAAFVKKFFA